MHAQSPIDQDIFDLKTQHLLESHPVCRYSIYYASPCYTLLPLLLVLTASLRSRKTKFYSNWLVRSQWLYIIVLLADWNVVNLYSWPHKWNVNKLPHIVRNDTKLSRALHNNVKLLRDFLVSLECSESDWRCPPFSSMIGPNRLFFNWSAVSGYCILEKMFRNVTQWTHSKLQLLWCMDSLQSVDEILFPVHPLLACHHVCLIVMIHRQAHQCCPCTSQPTTALGVYIARRSKPTAAYWPLLGRYSLPMDIFIHVYVRSLIRWKRFIVIGPTPLLTCIEICSVRSSSKPWPADQSSHFVSQFKAVAWADLLLLVRSCQV